MVDVLNQDIDVHFEVLKILYRNDENGYTVAKGKFIKYPLSKMPTTELIVVGYFTSVLEEDEFIGKGCWVKHNIYGYQFKIDNPRRIMPETQKGLISFIQKFVKGIGKPTAEKIVRYFGSDTLRVIENDWEQLCHIKGVGRKTAKKIHDKIMHNKAFEEIAMFIISHGGNFRLALRAFEEFGSDTLYKIKENPYNLASIPKIDFLQVDIIAKNLEAHPNNNLRIAEAIRHYLKFDSENKGNLYLEKNVLKKELPIYLVEKGAFPKKISNKSIDKGLEILTNRNHVVDVKGEEDLIYLTHNYYVENKIVELLKKHLTEFKFPIGNSEKIESFIDYYDSKNTFKLADNQKNAIRMALKSGFSILTGGPGTGKTQTINSIIHSIKYMKPSATIHLCAPTGKASKRMTELTGMEAFTIHRLIGLNMFDSESEVMEISGDFVIVDESSMVDAFVFYKLLSAVDENTRLLFVGDHNQLPSVGAGLILRDLIDSGKIPVTILDKIFRQAESSQIVMNAHKMIHGRNDLTFDESKEDFYFIERKKPEDIRNVLIKSIKRMIKKGYKLSDIQVLAPIKKTDLGVYEFNNIIQQEFNAPSFDKSETRNEHGIIRQFDKVIQTANNYDLEVFNGEVGYVNFVCEDDNGDQYVEVEYDFGSVEYDNSNVNDILLANAMTIHKSQGSEFPVVIMVLHEKYKNVLNRNVIYTGITRAKEKVVMIGQRSMLDYAISVEDNIQRNSQIKERLIKEI